MSSGQRDARPFALLGHAINHIQDRMAAGEPSFRVAVTAELAGDDCFRTVLAGFVEDSPYTLSESVLDEYTVLLALDRR